MDPFISSVPDKEFAQREGETCVYRSALLDEEEPLINEPFLGNREIIQQPDGTIKYGKYLFRSYNEINQDVVCLAKSLAHYKLYSEVSFKRKKQKLIGIYAKNCEGWVVSDLACCMASIGTVTLYDTLGEGSTDYIINQAEISTVVCTSNHIKSLIKIKEEGKSEILSNLIVLDEISEEQKMECKGLMINIYSLSDLINEGFNLSADLEDPDPDSIFTICYTSGTTGNPKGVVLSHQNIIAELANLQKSSFRLRCTDVHISYLPLAHIMERVLIHAMILNGCRVGFYQGDVLKLKDDLAELRPTIFVSVPRLYCRFYDLMQSKLNELKGCKKSLADKAIKAKLANLAKSGKTTHCFYDLLVFKKFKAVLGGRVRLCATASAPISKDILDFMKIAFCCPVIEAYGQTELAGASNCTDERDASTGHVGGVLPSFYMKLQDVPEMDYYSTDTVDGVLHPRGEVCFKGAPCFVGYFKEPEKTSETIDNEGWLHTGDIGVILPGGSLKIVDRKKNIFKLSQGEYIAAEKLEILYSKSPLIKQIFVYGDSLQSNLVTIIVPEKDEVVKEFPDSASKYEEFINSKDFHAKLSSWFDSVRKTEKLNGLEVPKRIHCTSREFSIEDGTLTPTFKLVRGDAKKMYINEIRKMYDGAKLQGE